MTDKPDLKIKKWPAKIAIILLFLSIFPWEYAFYYLAKMIVSVIAAYYCYKNYSKHKEQNKYFWYFLAITILYNPLLPIHLFFQLLWIIADIIAIIFFFHYLKSIPKKSST